MKITMSDVASYADLTVLETDKKVTLVYGLNGTGKSTLSNFLFDPAANAYKKCAVEGLENTRLYVYNSRFVKENFHEMDKLNGIFTLSKANKEVEEELSSANQILAKEQARKLTLTGEVTSLTNAVTLDKEKAEEVTWKIKIKFAGGDRVLEYCLDGLKTKARLFDHLFNIALPGTKPVKTTDDLKAEVAALQGENAQRYAKLSKFSIDNSLTEQNELFKTAIVGNKDSSVAALMARVQVRSATL